MCRWTHPALSATVGRRYSATTLPRASTSGPSTLHLVRILLRCMPCGTKRDILKSGSPVMPFIDNLSLVAGLCKVSSMVSDFGGIVHAIHLALAFHSCRVCLEQVGSMANTADGGSRLGPKCPEAGSLGVSLNEAPRHPWPRRPVEAPPEDWLNLYNGSGAGVNSPPPPTASSGHCDLLSILAVRGGRFDGDWPQGRSSGPSPWKGPIWDQHRHCT